MASTEFTPPTASAAAAASLFNVSDRRRHAERTLFLRRRLADVIRQHPGVADVTLECDGSGGPWSIVRARIVPDPLHAAGVVRLLEARRAGLIDESQCTVLPDGTVAAHQNKGETEFVYKEIFEDRSYIRHGIIVKDGDCIFDVGANIGLFSLHAGRLASALRIFAFEPLPPLYRLLQANRAVCGMTNVKAFCYGLSHTAGTETFTYYPRNSIMSGRLAYAAEDGEVVKAWLSRQMRQAGVGTEADALVDGVVRHALASERFDCALKSISDVIAEHGLHRIDLLKIDAEKSELDVLQGIAETDWPKIRQVVAEVYDGDGRLDAVLDLLRRHGFQLVVDQDESLRGTRVHMVYAMHADARQAAAATAPVTPAAEAPWRNNPALLAEDVRRHVAARLPDCCQVLEVEVAAGV